jgi:lysophospholipase L1-like esterase
MRRALGLLGPLLVAALLLLGLEVALRVGGFSTSSAGGNPKRDLLPLFLPAVRQDGVPIMERKGTPITFRRDKPANGFRVFVIGESSVFGYPYATDLAFSQFLQDYLAAAWPERLVEVVNAGVPAIGSWHTRRIVEEEVVRYQPDVVVIYTGHNDWILPPPETVSPIAAMAARLRVYQLAAATGAAWRRWRYGPVDPARLNLRTDPWGYARDRARGRAILTERERGVVVSRYADNLRAMVTSARAAGARVAIASLGQNLRDFPPGVSLQRRGLTAEARARWRAAVDDADRLARAGDCRAALARLDTARRIDRHPALVHFARARCLDQLGRFASARAAYRQASNLDGIPLGTPSLLNARMQAVAAETGAEFVDVAAALQRASAHGLVGRALFCDHLHPTVAGHAVIARAFARGLGADVRAGAPAVDARLRASPDPRKPEAIANIVLYLTLGWYDAAVREVRAIRSTIPDFAFEEKHVEYLRAQETPRASTDLAEALD